MNINVRANRVDGLADLHSDIASEITCIRNYTLEPLIPHIKAHLYEKQIITQWNLSGYNNARDYIYRDVDLTNTSVLFISLAPMYFADSLDFTWVANDTRNTELLFGELLTEICSLIDASRSKYHGPILVSNYFRIGPDDNAYLRVKNCKSLEDVYDAANKALIDAIERYEGVFILDFVRLIGKSGLSRDLNIRDFATKLLPFPAHKIPEVGKLIAGAMAPVLNVAKKCLVLDCDGVLWGGVLGEDGSHGICVDDTTSLGAQFRFFQNKVYALRKKGIILSLCSKNNWEDVDALFKECPTMPLKIEDFSSPKINWKTKVENLKEIASELNIGLDSIVFVDDSDYECDLVRRELPEVTVLKMGQNPVEFCYDLLHGGLFSTTSLTSEDLVRSEMYKANLNRSKAKEAEVDISSFLSSLDMRATIFKNRAEKFLRVAQLTQKTNQFNLTTHRYSDKDIHLMCNSSEYNIYALELNDKFGPYGIIGVAIIHMTDCEHVIDTFLLSCRAIGRGVEHLLLRTIEEDAKACGLPVRGKFRKTHKNQQVSNYYPMNGYDLVAETELGIEYLKRDIREPIALNFNIRVSYE